MIFLSYLLSITVILSLVLTYYLYIRRSHNHRNAPEPPGSWPIIGHLHLLGGQDPVCKILGALADKHGPIFTIRLGSHKALVISNWEAVKECFTTNDKILNKRPDSAAGKYLGYNNAGFGFTQGPYWREIRKLVLVEVLSARRLETLSHIRELEIKTSVNELYRLVQESPGRAVNLSQWIERLTLNVIVMTIAGKRYNNSGTETETEEARSFAKVIKEFMHVSGQFVPSDSISLPFLARIDLQGHIKSMKRIANELSVIVDKWIEEHVEEKEKNEEGDARDFIDVMLSTVDDNKFSSFGHTRSTIIKATVLNLLLAGSDSTSIALTWLLSLLLNHKQVLERARDEVNLKVGKDRAVQESDIKNLVYLHAIVKEALRLYPPGPLSVPHEAIEDCQVANYRVAKGTRVMVNVWKLHRDPSVWAEPDRFMPERFLTAHKEVEYSGKHYEFVPFGSGRRSCPGITFAMQVTHLTLARLIQGFDFSALGGNEPVDMSEGLAITLPKAKPLEVVITPRLSTVLYED